MSLGFKSAIMQRICIVHVRLAKQHQLAGSPLQCVGAKMKLLRRNGNIQLTGPYAVRRIVRGKNMASAVARAYMGVWGIAPSKRPGFVPQKLKNFCNYVPAVLVLGEIQTHARHSCKHSYKTHWNVRIIHRLL